MGGPRVLFPVWTRHQAVEAEVTGDPHPSSALYCGDSQHHVPTHSPCWNRSSASLAPIVRRMKQEDPAGCDCVMKLSRTAVREARHLGSDKLSLVIYSRSSKKGKCNNFLSTLGYFPLLLPSPRSLDTFLFGKVHCDILYHSLHLLIALAAPGVHFQDTLGEGGLLAAALQLTTSGKWQVLIDVLQVPCFLSLSLSLKEKKKRSDEFSILLGPVDFILFFYFYLFFF